MIVMREDFTRRDIPLTPPPKHTPSPANYTSTYRLHLMHTFILARPPTPPEGGLYEKKIGRSGEEEVT